jgi:hypothetical protein
MTQRGDNYVAHADLGGAAGEFKIDGTVVTATADELNAVAGDDAITNALLTPSALKSYRFLYDYSVHGGATGTIILTATDGQLPDNFCQLEVLTHCVTPVTSGGAATIAIGSTGTATKFLSATAYTDNRFDTARELSVISGHQMFDISGVSDVIFTVADADLTAGKVEVFVVGFEGL